VAARSLQAEEVVQDRMMIIMTMKVELAKLRGSKAVLR